ncbi:Putative UPF0481 protein At3g02645 [Linum perenne]
MASSSSSSSIINPTFTEQKWLSSINTTLKLDLETLTETTTFTIFNLPDSLKSTSPESYTPQLIAVGPIHQFNPELYPMQTIKLAAAKRSQSLLHLPDFQSLVDSISRFVPKIRASYDKHFEIGDEAMSWIAAVDGLFLLDHLRRDCEPGRVGRVGRVFRDSGERKNGRDAVRRDLVKLENQIPLFLLKEMVANCSDSGTGIGAGDEGFRLTRSVVEFCRNLSPFDIHEPLIEIEIEQQHLLGFLYQLIWLKEKDRRRLIPQGRAAIQKIASEFIVDLWEEAKTSDDFALIQSVANPIDRAIRLSKTLGISSKLRKLIAEEDEQVLIPTASKLKAVGIEFCCSRDGIRSLDFDPGSKMFRVPGFAWNSGCCEVVMRNLVAYESMAKAESLVVNRYVEIMGCLVQSVADVKLLKEEGIILFAGEEAKDQEEAVLEFFKGITTTVHPNRNDKTVFDDHIKAVNEHYNNHRRIKMGKMVKSYLKVSWDVAKVIAAVLLLVMLGVQTFCDVYKCKGKSVLIHQSI